MQRQREMFARRGIARRLLVLLQSLVLGHLARTGANSCSDTHFEAKVNVSEGHAWLGAVVVEDFDGDGVPDIASVRKGSSTITWFRNLLRQSGVNNVTFQNPGSVVAKTGVHLHNKFTRSIVAGDFDGDGSTAAIRWAAVGHRVNTGGSENAPRQGKGAARTRNRNLGRAPPLNTP